MGGTGGEGIVLHPMGTFSEVTPYRSRIKGKIFADMFKWRSCGGTGGGQTSDPVVVGLRTGTGSFSDATPNRGKIKGKIFADLIRRGSSDSLSTKN